MPPHILEKLLTNDDQEIREIALSNMLTNSRLGGERKVQSLVFGGAPGGGMRTVYNCKNRATRTQAVVARSESSSVSNDASVNAAFDGLGKTRDFYQSVLNRNSLDDRGMRLEAFVHYDLKLNNAFWDGRVMVFGDGDGRLFSDLTKSLDVIAHELTHGVTEFTAGLAYHNESGALNESMSDVFGSLVKQWSLTQRASQADWLIGADIFTPNIKADALRSMKAPGTAYDNSILGKDPQPAHMSRFVRMPDTQRGDWGGVHVNSGIPNKAFYLAAIGLGGYAWQEAGHVWYESLLASNSATNFRQFAETTVLKAGQLYGASKAKIVADAWAEVGLPVALRRSLFAAQDSQQLAGLDAAEARLAELATTIDALAARVRELTNDVERSMDSYDGGSNP